MAPVGFEPTISAGERPQTYALDRAATGTGTTSTLMTIKNEYNDELARDTVWEMLILKTKEKTEKPLRTAGQDVNRTLFNP